MLLERTEHQAELRLHSVCGLDTLKHDHAVLLEGIADLLALRLVLQHFLSDAVDPAAECEIVLQRGYSDRHRGQLLFLPMRQAQFPILRTLCWFTDYHYSIE